MSHHLKRCAAAEKGIFVAHPSETLNVVLVFEHAAQGSMDIQHQADSLLLVPVEANNGRAFLYDAVTGGGANALNATRLGVGCSPCFDDSQSSS